MSKIQSALENYSNSDLNTFAIIMDLNPSDVKEILDGVARKSKSSTNAEEILATSLDKKTRTGGLTPIRVVHASNAGIAIAAKAKKLTPEQLAAAKKNIAGSIPDVVILKGDAQVEVIRIEVKYTKSKFTKFPIASAPSSAYDYYVMFQKKPEPKSFVLSSGNAIIIKRGSDHDVAAGDYNLEDIFPDGKLAAIEELPGLKKDNLGSALQRAIISRLARAVKRDVDVDDLKNMTMTIKDEQGNPLRIDGSRVRIDLKFEQKLRKFVRQILTEATK